MFHSGARRGNFGVGQSKGRGARKKQPARASREELVGTHVIREALRAQRRRLYRLSVKTGGRGEEIEELCDLAADLGVPWSEDPDLVEGRAGNVQGAVLTAGPLPQLSLEDLIVSRPETDWRLVALDGVEDPQNLGAIARVAEGVGAHALILTERRAPPVSAAVSRASAGAVEWLPVARVPNLAKALTSLRAEGVWSFGAEVGSGTSLYEVPARWLKGDRVLVLGAEGRGLPEGVRGCLDYCVEIPTVGRIESLNVATAAAVLLFEFQRRG